MRVERERFERDDVLPIRLRLGPLHERRGAQLKAIELVVGQGQGLVQVGAVRKGGQGFGGGLERGSLAVGVGCM